MFTLKCMKIIFNFKIDLDFWNQGYYRKNKSLKISFQSWIAVWEIIVLVRIFFKNKCYDPEMWKLAQFLYKDFNAKFREKLPNLVVFLGSAWLLASWCFIFDLLANRQFSRWFSAVEVRHECISQELSEMTNSTPNLTVRSKQNSEIHSPIRVLRHNKQKWQLPWSGR